MLQFSDPNLGFEPGTTSGTFSSVARFQDFVADGKVDIDALHYVTRSITLGSGGNTLTLQAGDLLFSTLDDETLTSSNSLAVLDDEVILFRPDTPNDYTAGTFTVVLDNFGALHGGNDTWSLTLVEQNTVLGDVTLTAGTFLFSRDGGAEDNDIYRFVPTGVGAGGTAGTVQVLIKGDDIGINPKIWGLELIEASTTIGNVTLPASALLVTLDANDGSVGTNGIAVNENDIFYLTVSQTTLGSGTAVANATLFFEGLDVGLDGGAETPNALTLVVCNQPPAIALPGGDLNYTENDPATVIDAAATVTDMDSPNLATGTLTVNFTAGGTADDRLAIRNQGAGAGQIGVSGANVTYGGAVIGTWSGGGDGATPLVVTLTTNATPAAAQALLRNITYQNVSEAPSAAARTVRFVISDGDGGTSSPVTRQINLTAVNDGPVLSVPGVQSTNEDVPLVFSSANGNAITVADVDAGANSIQVTLVAGNGTVSLRRPTGLSFSSGDGSGDATMIFTGTLANINAALNGLTFTPAANHTGAASLQVDANDQGNAGSGGPRAATAAVAINCLAVNDAPVLDNAGAMTLAQIFENDISNGGNTVAELLASAGGDRVTDADSGAVEGIAIIAADNTNGTWQYSVDGGALWYAIGSVTNGSCWS